MKHIYWRPTSVPRLVLFLIAALALGGMVSVEVFQIKKIQPHFREKMNASRLAREALKVVKEERLRRKIPIDPETDPTESGMIGVLVSPVTSNAGVLSAKQTSTNPNFAAMVVQLLKQANVEENEIVAVSFSGSFPAINACVCAALETLKLKPIIISSASASSWGANIPKFLWIDMEKVLYDRQIISFHSVAASIGGVEDSGVGMLKEGVQMLEKSIQRLKLPFIDPIDFQDSIGMHMAIYQEQAGDQPIKAYINVGGGTTSVGTKIGKKLFRPGLNLRMPPEGPPIDSVMSKMVEMGIPAIHLVKIEELAKRYGLPIQPLRKPIVGEGKVFYRQEYNPYLTVGVLVLLFSVIYLFVRSDWGFRILFARGRRSVKKPPEPMV